MNVCGYFIGKNHMLHEALTAPISLLDVLALSLETQKYPVVLLRAVSIHGAGQVLQYWYQAYAEENSHPFSDLTCLVLQV